MVLLAGVDREPGGAAAGAATTGRRESGVSVASCLSSGPLVEVRSGWVGNTHASYSIPLLYPPTGALGLDAEEGSRHAYGQQDAEAPLHPVRQPRAALLRGQVHRGYAWRCGGSFALEGLARKGRIRMATATELARHRLSDSKDFTFVIKVPGRDWVLDPGSEAAYQMWEAKLRPMLG